MLSHAKRLAQRALVLWENRDLHALEKLRRQSGASEVSRVQYFAGLALNALNRRREAIECWRKAEALDPRNEDAIRTLAYELLEQAPLDAAELFYRLVGLNRANADDFTCLGEIRIKQDRLGEAHRWLKRAIELEPKNGLALLALATLYVQVGDPSLALDHLQRAADTEGVDFADMESDPQFESLWNNATFQRMVSSDR